MISTDSQKKYVVAFDQGTTSSRAIVLDHDANVITIAQREFTQIYPQPGWVEHDPMEIWATQSAVWVEALAQASISSDQIAAIGITNQRETTVIWDKKTGKPIYNAIVWQSRQSNEICNQLRQDGWQDYIRKVTGLVIDPYFSATKIKWILDRVEGSRATEKSALVVQHMDLHVSVKFIKEVFFFFNFHTKRQMGCKFGRKF